MEHSEQIGELISALAKAQAEFQPALKDSANPYYNSKYADLATVIAAVRPALTKHGIALIQSSASDIERQVASVTTSLHCGDQWISSTAEAPAIGKAKDSQIRFDVQTIGAAWTYLRRYTLQALVGIASEDDDGNSLITDAPLPQRTEKVYVPKTNPPSAERDAWLTAFSEAATLDEFNQQIVPLAKERGREFVLMMADEAKKRKYLPDRATGLYTQKAVQ